MENFFRELRRRNVVRVAGVYVVVGWLLVQIATTLEESIGLPAWFDGLIVALLLIGLPIALIFAWAFELTPEGVVRTEDVPEAESITSQTGRKLDYAIIAGIVALGAIMLWRGAGSPESGAGPVPAHVAAPAAADPVVEKSTTPLDKSIAVLPFANRSPNPEDAFFAEGMHDDLLTHLSKIGDMHVISRTSVMGYAGAEHKIPDIARELGVATVMEGAVQRAGSRVRINVQLIDAETDAHLWAEIYDRELTAENVFEIQSEITRAIAGALNSVLSSSDVEVLRDVPTDSLEAYDAYMTGRLHTSVYFAGIDRLNRAIDAFNYAIELDSEFAAAYAGRAYAQIAAYWWTAEEGDWRGDALASLQLAEALAPDAVETLTARGYYHYWGFLDYDAANAAFERALEIAPNYVEAISGYAFSMRREGRFDETITMLERAHRLDPMNMDVVLSLAETYAKTGHFDDARAALRRSESMETSLGLAFDASQVSFILTMLGDAEGAWHAIKEPQYGVDVGLYSGRVSQAIATRNASEVRMALDTWPDAYHRTGDAPEAYELTKARALLFLAEEGEAQQLLAGVKERIDASPDPYPQGWKANAVYWPVELPSLMRDLDGVRAAVAEYEATALPDAFGQLSQLPFIAAAFAQAGDPDAAFAYIDRLLEMAGPWAYAELTLNVDFDPIRNDPRWLGLKTDYEDWAASQP